MHVIEKTKADLSPVELPHSLRNYKSIYTPQQQHLEGYMMMPRSLCPPYSNYNITKLDTQVDWTRKDR